MIMFTKFVYTMKLFPYLSNAKCMQLYMNMYTYYIHKHVEDFHKNLKGLLADTITKNL